MRDGRPWWLLAALVACVTALAGGLAVVAAYTLGQFGADAGSPIDDASDGQVTTPGAARNDASACRRPYGATSPWNTPIGPSPRVDHPRSARVDAIEGPLTSDPTQYTYPVYEVSSDTASEPVQVDGRYSDVSEGGRRLEIHDETTVRLPIPGDAKAAQGSDAQIILVDYQRGDEWGAWQLRRTGGRWMIENGYHYNIRWDGVPPRESGGGDPFGSRGAGVPYLAGLVRPCEIERGRIDHALAFAYHSPSPEHVYPATKSDGEGQGPEAMPEGTRLQLDPSLTREELERRGCIGPCLVIARALQRYGMYIIDASGRPKVMLEYDGTARWGDQIDSKTVSPIPMSAFRVVESPPRPASER